MNISVFGMGYVGVVTAACLAARGHRVIGVDINPRKVELLNSGRSPIVEEGVEDLLKTARREKRFSATEDARHAVRQSAVAIICIGTPSRANGSLDTRFIENAARTIGLALKEKKEPLIIVLRSTVTPGTTEEVILPILEELSGKKEEKDFHLAYQPEFLREGSAVEDFNHPAKRVVGTGDPTVAETIFSIYEGIDAVQFRTDIATAEMVKYADNAFHALKITFANEIGHLCKKLGLPTDTVMEIFKKDRKLNISERYLTPGFAFGGSCLPKDLRALTYLAAMHNLETPLLSAILESNRAQVLIAVQHILTSGKRKIGLAGLSFKAGTDDVRESPLVEVAEILQGKGFSLSIYDPNLHPEKLIGANKDYLEKHLRDFSSLLVPSLNRLLTESELIVIGNNADEFTDLPSKIRPDQRILDCAGIGGKVGAQENYEGICW